MKIPTFSRNFVLGLVAGSLVGLGLFFGIGFVFAATPQIGYIVWFALLAFWLYSPRIIRKLFGGQEDTPRFQFVNGVNNGTALPFLIGLAAIIVYWSYLLIVHFLSPILVYLRSRLS